MRGKPKCLPEHAEYPKCQRPDGWGWTLALGRSRRYKHDTCSECGCCYDCANGTTSDPIKSAVELLDDLLVVHVPRDQWDERGPRAAMEAIAEARRQNPAHPITLSLAIYMREHGIIEDGEPKG